MSFLKIFVNSSLKNNQKEIPKSAYLHQLNYIKQAWNEDTYGIDTLVRLFLTSIQLFFPILLIREISGRLGGVIGRKLTVEFYTVLKFLFPLVVILKNWVNPFVVFLIVYFLIETIAHILHLIFLSDKHHNKVTYRRSILLIFFNFAEVVLDYAVIYKVFNLLNTQNDAISVIYFSVVASTTVGFGDILVTSSFGKFVVISQLIVFLLFIVLFINYFSSSEKE